MMQVLETTFTVHILLQIHSITDDGLRFKQLYHVETFPYISIIDPRTGIFIHMYMNYLQKVCTIYILSVPIL